ncbi:MAG: PAS domain-containing protein, partial [Rhodoferax sp.]
TPPDANAALTPAQARALRQKAEAKWQKIVGTSAERVDDLTVAASHSLLQELRVHQIELEMQNEELRRAKHELEISRASYLNLYELAPVGYCSVSEAGLLQQANLTLANLLGVVRSKMRRSLFSSFVYKADQDHWYQLRRQLLDTGAPQTSELRLRLAEGAPLWVHLSATVAQDDAVGRSLRVIVSDISARKHAEAALLESDARWKFAVDGLGDGLWDWHIQTGVAFFSARYKEMFGYAEADIGATANEWIRRLHPDDAPAVMAALQPCLDGGAGSASSEFRMLCKDGSWRWTLGRGMVVSRDAQGRALRLIGTNTDISERKQAQAVDQFLGHAGSGADAEPFFAALARFLAQTLQMDYICIDRLEGDHLNATTLAIWHDGHFDDNLSYALADTPCTEVVRQRVCCYPANVCQAFPNDAALQELRAQSYIGVTLWSHTGQPIGLIAAISRRPLSNRTHAQTTLVRVAVRAAGELERLDAETALRLSEHRLSTVLDSTREAIAVHQQGRLVFVNPAAVEMLHATSEQDLLGQPLLNFVHPDFHQMVLARIKTQAANGLALPMIEEKFIRLDQVAIDVEVQASQIVYGGQAAVQVTMRDVTEHKQTQAKLQLAASVFS